MYAFQLISCWSDFSGHNSMIYFVDEVGPSPLAQSVAFRDLPLRDVGQKPFSGILMIFFGFFHAISKDY